MKLPSISIIIATYNSDRTLQECLSSLFNQDYPKDKLELIIADGGSTDKTLQIAKKFKAQVVTVPKNKQGAEQNKAFGLAEARGEFILMIDYDNILPHKNWLKNMLKPHFYEKDLVATEPLRYHYSSNMSILDRYFALFGVNDPVPYYLGKADRMDYFHDTYNLLGDALDRGDYYKVLFDKKNPRKIPTLGANGFLIKRSFFLKSKHKPGEYFHIDINVDLVGLGFNKYAFIKDDITHLTNSSFLTFIKRRKHFMDKYYFEDSKARRYSVFYKDDLLKLFLFIVYTVTIVRPMVDSIRGFLRIHDLAWFVHPFMCFAMLYIYGTSTVKKVFNL